MRSRVVLALEPLRGFAVENPALPGTPDVAFVGGWVECKWVPRWPRGERTPVAMDHFTPQQRIWLRRWARAGGRAWVLLQCQKTQEWLLIDGPVAATILGYAHVGELISKSDMVWTGRSFDAEVAGCLSKLIASRGGNA